MIINDKQQAPFILYLQQQICSRMLYADNEENASLYTMDTDESISEEHQESSNFYVLLEGELQLIVPQQANFTITAGEAAYFPAHLRHSLYAVTRCAYIKLQVNAFDIPFMNTETDSNNTITNLGGNTMDKLLINKLPQGEVITLTDSIEYVAGQITSKTLVQRPELGMTLFAVDQDQQIRRHVATGDALVQMLDGEAEIEIGEETHVVRAGESIVMPVGIPHALYARKAFKFLLTVVKTVEAKE